MRTVWLLGLLCFSAGIQGCAPAVPGIAARIKAFSAAPRVGGEWIAESATVSRFYKRRGSQPAWLDHADEIVAAIRGTEADGLDPAAYHLDALLALLRERRSSPRTAEGEATLDVLLADAVASVADDMRFGRVLPSRVNPEWTTDPRDGASPLDSTLAAIAGSGSIRAALEAQRPDHFIYRGLMTELGDLRRIEATGGWSTVRPGRDLAPGAWDPRVAQVRRRLREAGDLQGAVPRDSLHYDADLTRAVGRFQARHRIGRAGLIDRATIAALNVSTTARIDQVRVNLERSRWVLGDVADDFLLVNLPAFKAYLIRGRHNIWESRTQIGQEAMQTPTFRADIRPFSPTRSSRTCARGRTSSTRRASWSTTVRITWWIRARSIGRR